jgi:hypothetical protein
MENKLQEVTTEQEKSGVYESTELRTPVRMEILHVTTPSISSTDIALANNGHVSRIFPIFFIP